MKKVLTLLLVALSLSAMAQERPQPTPEQKWAAANVVTSLTVGWLVLPMAILTGKREQLCLAMGGRYDPNGADQCPTGQWANLVVNAREK